VGGKARGEGLQVAVEFLVLERQPDGRGLRVGGGVGVGVVERAEGVVGGDLGPVAGEDEEGAELGVDVGGVGVEVSGGVGDVWGMGGVGVLRVLGWRLAEEEAGAPFFGCAGKPEVAGGGEREREVGEGDGGVLEEGDGGADLVEEDADGESIVVLS